MTHYIKIIWADLKATQVLNIEISFIVFNCSISELEESFFHSPNITIFNDTINQEIWKAFYLRAVGAGRSSRLHIELVCLSFCWLANTGASKCKRLLLMSLSFLLQQYHTCLVHITSKVDGHTAAVLWSVVFQDLF